MWSASISWSRCGDLGSGADLKDREQRDGTEESSNEHRVTGCELRRLRAWRGDRDSNREQEDGGVESGSMHQGQLCSAGVFGSASATPKSSRRRSKPGCGCTTIHGLSPPVVVRGSSGAERVGKWKECGGVRVGGVAYRLLVVAAAAVRGGTVSVTGVGPLRHVMVVATTATTTQRLGVGWLGSGAHGGWIWEWKMGFRLDLCCGRGGGGCGKGAKGNGTTNDQLKNCVHVHSISIQIKTWNNYYT